MQHREFVVNQVYSNNNNVGVTHLWISQAVARGDEETIRGQLPGEEWERYLRAQKIIEEEVMRQKEMNEQYIRGEKKDSPYKVFPELAVDTPSQLRESLEYILTDVTSPMMGITGPAINESFHTKVTDMSKETKTRSHQ